LSQNGKNKYCLRFGIVQCVFSFKCFKLLTFLLNTFYTFSSQGKCALLVMLLGAYSTIQAMPNNIYIPDPPESPMGGKKTVCALTLHYTFGVLT
jgi:hypothetical protein